MNEFWFKPKTYGYGATPITWEGWTVVAVYVMAIVACVTMGALREKTVSNWAMSICMIAIATVAMVWVSVIKMEGHWGWRWGADHSPPHDRAG